MREVKSGIRLVGTLLMLAACSTGRVATVSSDPKPEEEGLVGLLPPDAGGLDARVPVVTGEETGPFYEPEPQGRPTGILRGDAPNIHYAELDRPTCLAELGRRAITFAHAPDTAGVMTPIWLRGPLHGIAIHSELAVKQREHSSAEIFDCRLVLALDDFAALLAQQDIVEIVHLSGYRPRNAGGCTPKYVGKQHCAALAVDVGAFKKKDGTVLQVLRDFHGRVGLATCTTSAKPSPASAASDQLWGFVCDAARRAIFHVILTPNFNAAHKNHLHLEITPDAGWMLIH